MATKSPPKRKTVKSLTISQKVKCSHVIPMEGSAKTIENLKTIGFTLDREQAIQLARILLAVTQEWDTMNVTVFREKRKLDGLCNLTVTNLQKSK
jgi:hypothetical protein